MLSAAFLLLSARWLGPVNRGTHALLQSGAQFGAALLGLGFSGAVPVIIGRNQRTLSWVLRQQWKLAAVELVVAATLLFAAARSTVPALQSRELILTLTVVALSIQIVAFNAALAMGDARTPNSLTVLGTVVSLVILLVARAGNAITVNLVLSAQLAGIATGALLNVRVLRRRARHLLEDLPGEELLHAVFLPSVQGYLSTIFALALFRADIFIVERWGGGLRNAGLYSVAIFAAELMLKVPQWASGVLTASVAMEVAQGPKRTIALCTGSVLAAALCLLPLAFFPSVFDAMLAVALGKDYRGIAVLMLALGPRIILQAGTLVLAANLAGRGFTWYHPLASAAGMLGVIALDLVLVPRFGPLGAGIASSAGYSFAAAVMLRGFLVYEGISLRQAWHEAVLFIGVIVTSTRRIVMRVSVTS
jgi:O-antigen/teichoic acid export membrane protein